MELFGWQLAAYRRVEFPLNTHESRRLLREHLQAEGESLVLRMQAENWFQGEGGCRLAARFLAQRLESISWKLGAMRMQPWLDFAEAVCPGATAEIPPRLLAFATQTLRNGESCLTGDAYRDCAGQRWLVDESLPWGAGWALPQSVHPGLRWPAGFMNSGGDICSLYRKDGQPLWALLAWAQALRGANGTPFRLMPWVGCQSDTLRYVRHELSGFGWCGLRLWSGSMPEQWPELEFVPDSDHPFTRLPGFFQLESLWKVGHPLPAVILRADDPLAGDPGPGLLTAALSDTPWQRLELPGQTVYSRSEPEIRRITDVLSRWGRWVFEGAGHREFAPLLPRLDRLELLDGSPRRMRFRVISSSWSPHAWVELGCDLAKIQMVLRRCAWLGGNPIWEHIPWEFQS